MDIRYQRNIPAISEDEQRLLGEKKVLVIGCGGLGGYLVEHLARMGVGELTAVDGDTFEPSNLNRQLLSSESVLGQSKVLTAEQRVHAVNPNVMVHAVEAYLNPDNADLLVSGQDLALDALDNVPARLLLEDACARRHVPIVHGAIFGWTAQIAVVPPGSGILHRLYERGACQEKTSLTFTVSFCAAVQAAQAVKLLCGHSCDLAGRLLLADLQRMDWDILPI